METSEISAHELEVYVVMKHGGKWMSNREIAAECRVAKSRTVRHCTLKFLRLGLADCAEVFPAHRYRLSPKAGRRNAAYVLRLTKAAEALGVTL